MRRTRRIAGLGAATLLALAGGIGAAEAQQRQFFQVAPGARLDSPDLLSLQPRPVIAMDGARVMDRGDIRRWLCPNGGAPVPGRPGRCDGRGTARAGTLAGGTGGVGRYGQDPDVVGWHADLPRASGRQTSCPEGTVATEARANPGTVRCLPG